MSHRFRIETQKVFFMDEVHPILLEAKSLLGADIEAIEEWNVFRIEVGTPLNSSTVEEVFVDPILERLYWEDGLMDRHQRPDWIIEIQYRPGVTDNIGRSAEDALRVLGIKDSRVATGRLWLIDGALGSH